MAKLIFISDQIFSRYTKNRGIGRRRRRRRRRSTWSENINGRRFGLLYESFAARTKNKVKYKYVFYQLLFIILKINHWQGSLWNILTKKIYFSSENYLEGRLRYSGWSDILERKGPQQQVSQTNKRNKNIYQWNFPFSKVAEIENSIHFGHLPKCSRKLKLKLSSSNVCIFQLCIKIRIS